MVDGLVKQRSSGRLQQCIWWGHESWDIRYVRYKICKINVLWKKVVKYSLKAIRVKKINVGFKKRKEILKVKHKKVQKCWGRWLDKLHIIYSYSMVCLNTGFWLADRYAVKLFNAQVVPSQFNHRSILMRFFNWCTQTNTHHSCTLTHTEREIEFEDCTAHTHKLVVNASPQFWLIK